MKKDKNMGIMKKDKNVGLINKDKKVGIIMGSDSDLKVMAEAADFLKSLDIPFELTIVSAHRTPDRLMEYGKGAEAKGLEVIIAGAGGAAHLPGMVASITTLPVIGVPVKSRISMDGWDSVLSILQMPPGVPVATVALDAGRNAGILAAQILASTRPELRKKIRAYKEGLKAMVMEKVAKVNEDTYGDLV